MSFALLAFGSWNLYRVFTGQHGLPGVGLQKYWIHVALGGIGIHSVTEDLKYMLRPRATPMAWWYKHMENMLGCGIGFHTAFLIFGVRRFINLQLSGPWQLLPWMIPAAIGLPAMSIWIRYYQRKFGELPDNTASTPAAASAAPDALPGMNSGQRT